MTPIPPANIDELIAEFVLAAERGQAPDPEDWLARHPEHAPELAAFVADLGRFAAFLGLPHLSDTDLTADFRGPAAPGEPSGSDGGRSFGGYELLGEIGQGGMGTVYRARLSGTTLVVALKQIRLCGRREEATSQFRKEIDSVAALRHPNIVPVYHVGEHEGWPFYTMALVEGGSLDGHLGRFRSDPKAAAMLMAKTAWAVHHAHQRRILHRDLKPGNILLDESGEPHVADFGLAARIDESGAATESGPPCGSLPWMAPEAVRGDTTLTTAVDLWAMGVILYELLTGERPFRGPTCREVRAAILESSDPPAPREVNPRVPRDLDAICRRCMAKDPDARYESASAVAIELERWLRDEPVRARRAGRGERLARWCRRNQGLALGAVFLCILLVAGATAAMSLIRNQDEATRQAVCRENEFAAELAAGAFLHRLDQYGDLVFAAADDQGLRTACKGRDLPAVRKFLRDKVETLVGPEGVLIATLSVMDDTGTVQGIWPQAAEVVGNNWRDRDYFRGARRRGGQEGSRRVYVSRGFTSRNDRLDKLAVSVAFRPSPDSDFWVLTATVPTDPTLGLGIRDDERHKVVLLAPRDTGSMSAPPETPSYYIMVHPSYVPREASVLFPAGKLRPVESPDGRPRFAPDDDYRDPVSQQHPQLAGRWIAGFASVEGTELVVLVQQRYDRVVASQRSFVLRFLAWVGGPVACGLLVFVSVRVVRARRLKTGQRSES